MYERSYHAKVLRAEQPEKKKRGISWRKVLWSSVCVVLLVGIVTLIKLPQMQVRTVTVTGTNVADPNDVSYFVMSMLEGRYLRFLPKTSILLVNTDTLAEQIKFTFPRFKDVAVGRSDLTTLEVTVSEYPGVYLWCGDDGACSFMDETGTVFAPAPYFSGTAYIKLYGGVRGEYPFVPIASANISSVQTIIDRLKDIQVEVIEARLRSAHWLDVAIMHRGKTAHLYFEPTKDVDAMLDAFYTGIKTEPLASKYRDDTQTLEYIDLRFANKIVYKFQ